ncbi:hypothetical protein MHLP_01140 [Candidatus Mycoplasma haematolamae str. Purdue]|uniref:Uncharacterized protein n=1 Tax=Mycoplasma haematolamae (strain Purdue) TaxID=1212765 RepID=I7BJ02_MYCHA|nr:hypothetical protein [Candidatus Mycoplasma haematolamae]AFO51808.1 hypothetical protein MHLP_01140 [Candidatus Mycoplasma haematolamae str. Purdue]
MAIPIAKVGIILGSLGAAGGTVAGTTYGMGLIGSSATSLNSQNTKINGPRTFSFSISGIVKKLECPVNSAPDLDLLFGYMTLYCRKESEITNKTKLGHSLENNPRGIKCDSEDGGKSFTCTSSQAVSAQNVNLRGMEKYVSSDVITISPV